jgi:hypothetical protein
MSMLASGRSALQRPCFTLFVSLIAGLALLRDNSQVA